MGIKNKFFEEYEKQMLDVMKKSNPTISKDKIKEVIRKTIKERVKDPEVTLDNNYTHETRKTHLSSVFHWALETDPIIAGNGTFYKQHKDARNPNSEMVDDFLDERKRLKSKMFSVEDESSHVYKDLDLKQGNEKRLANSYYGGSGSKTSAFYSKWSGPATTKSAQSVISSTETTFEAFLVDNFIFIDYNECISWINTVLHEDFVLDSWVKKVSFEDCYERISSKILGLDDSMKNSLYKYLKSMNENDWTHLYYKNNLIEFTRRHENVKELHHKIFSSINNIYQEYGVDKAGNFLNESDIMKIPSELRDRFLGEKSPGKAWNKFVAVQKFYDPNNVPDTIEKYLKELSEIYMKYIYVRFLHLDKIYRLKNFTRDVVTVIDTDSNILSLDTWMKFCQSELMHGNYGREYFDNVYIAINSITYIITSVVTDILLYYGECSNVEESHRPRYNMKNEFFFSKLIVAKTKKRYLSQILLREGNRLKKPKVDIKGFDLKKASTSEYASSYYINLIKRYLLEPETPLLKEMINELHRFKKEIRKSIESGERIYLPNANAKELGAYKDPSTSQGVRGVLAWNMCEPDKLIEFPAKVSLLKMNLEKEESLEDMKDKFPNQYKALKEGVFNDKTGIFIKQKKDPKTKEMVPYKIGVKVLAIPSTEKIPDWALPYIDYNTLVNNILGPFKSVLEIFNLPGVEEGKTGRKSTGLSNIIKL